MASLTEEELRRLVKQGLLTGGPSFTGGPYLGSQDITPVIEAGIGGLLDQPPTKVYEAAPVPLRDSGTHPRAVADPQTVGLHRPYYGEIHMRSRDELGSETFNQVLIHELKHAGIKYLRENPDLLPYIMHYMQYDEGEFGRSLRDLVKTPETHHGDREVMHKIINATSPRWLDRTDVIRDKQGLIDVPGFEGQGERDLYAEMMRIFNESLEKEKTKKKKKKKK